MRRALRIACLLAGLLALAPAASAATLTAHGGNVSATFTYSGQAPSYTGERLTIARGGHVYYDQPVASKFCTPDCGPTFEGRTLRVVQLAPGGARDVALDLFSGGAHCCTILQIFSWDPGTMTYVETQRNFGDPSVRFLDLRHNGRDELVTADDSFAYEFTSYAGSGLPIEILNFSGRRFVDVTRRYPKLVARDAAFWLNAFKHAAPSYQQTTGVIAAWAADEDLLGDQKLVSQYLSQQAAAGHLNSGGGSFEPSGKRFVTKLQKFLRTHGY